MKLEEQLCTLQQSIILVKELTVTNESLFYHTQDEAPTNQNLHYFGWQQKSMPWLIMYGKQSRLSTSNVFAEFPAFSVAELGLMLPDSITFNKTQKASVQFSKMNTFTIRYNLHSSGQTVFLTENTNEAIARAEMVIKLFRHYKLEAFGQ